MVAVTAQPPRGVAPAGVDDAALCAAMTEDVVDLVAGMQQVEAVLAGAPPSLAAMHELTWPGMPVVTVADPAVVGEVLARLEALGADEGTVVAGDAPDLPPLLLGKLHSALTTAEVAACPADGGGLVALAARLPAPGWLTGLAVSLDDIGALASLRAAAPRRALAVGTGWHRLRAPGDLARLDPGLEGWEATRLVLGG